MEEGKRVDAVFDLTRGVGSLPKGYFALGICCSVLEHVERPWSFARNLSRLIRPGGMLFLSVPWVWHYHAYPDDSRRRVCFDRKGGGQRDGRHRQCRRQEAEVSSVHPGQHARNAAIAGLRRKLNRRKSSPSSPNQVRRQSARSSRHREIRAAGREDPGAPTKTGRLPHPART